jgi:hypothetical protein
MAKLTHIERRRRAVMIVDLVVRGTVAADAGRQHGVTPTHAARIVQDYLRCRYIRQTEDGALTWTADGLRFQAWLDMAPEVVP